MDAAYKMAACAVRQRFAEQHPDDLEVLNRVTKADVAVYSGSYDQIENLLQVMGVPCTLDPEVKELRAKIVFVNCSGTYKHNLAGVIEPHVGAGNWLVTSDWALHYILEPNFPNTLKWNRKSSGEEVIGVEPGLDSLWSEIVVLGAEPQWWLWGSYPMEVLDTTRVQVEAASHDLLRKYQSPIVAARFAWGQGHVFHVISHFWARRSGTPTLRHQGTCVDFLKVGMNLSDMGIERVLTQSKVKPEDVNFASLQSAATATELVAQLCIRAKSGKGFPAVAVSVEEGYAEEDAKEATRNENATQSALPLANRIDRAIQRV